MGTKLLDVRRAVCTAIAALPEFTGPPKVEVMVSYKANVLREFCYTRRGRFTHRSAGMRSGSHTRHESATFDVVLWVQAPGKGGDEAAERVLELGHAVEAWVSSNKQGVGGAYTLTIEGEGELNDGQGDQGGLAEYVIPVHYDARLES